MAKFKRVVWDVETNGLLDVPVEDRVTWSIHLTCIDTEDEQLFKGDSLIDGINILANADLIIGHNIVGYDISWLYSVYGVDVAAKGRVWDTAIVSRLYKPDMNGHSLEAWGRRLGFPKMDYRGELIKIGALDPTTPKGDEFKTYHPLMDEYVAQDVAVCYKLYRAQVQIGQKEGWGATPEEQMNHLAFRMEHQAQRVLTEQEQRGWPFDSAKAKHLLVRIGQAFTAIDRQLDDLIPPVVEKKGVEIEEPLLKSGKGYKKSVIDHMEDDVYLVEGPFSRITIRRINYDSQHQLKQALTRLGWRATEFTDGGSPKLTETSLVTWKGKIGKTVSKRLMYCHRQGLISGLLKHVRSDGRVGAGGIAQGAITGRVTHRVVANIPRPSSPMGKQIRSLFRCEEGEVLVGTDASGLELRCLAHYVDDEAITSEILEGDIHQKNADACGVDRNTVKTLTYGWLYGAGDAKLGATALDSTIGQWCGTSEEGGIIRAKFLKSMNAEKLMLQVSKAGERGYLKGIDGRRIPIRSAHAALNTLLQSAGAIVMKLAYIKQEQLIKAHPEWEASVLCFYHKQNCGLAA